MKLTESQRAKLLAKIESFGGTTPCEVCRTNLWSVSEHVFEMRSYAGSLAVDGPVAPVVQMVCSICGLLRCFNAVVLGLVDRHTGGPAGA